MTRHKAIEAMEQYRAMTGARPDDVCTAAPGTAAREASTKWFGGYCGPRERPPVGSGLKVAAVVLTILSLLWWLL